MGTPKSSILIDGFATLNHPFVETSIRIDQILRILTTDHGTPVDSGDLLIALDHRGLHPVGGWVVPSVSIRSTDSKDFQYFQGQSEWTFINIHVLIS